MFRPLFSEAICSQENLVEAAIKSKQNQGGCCLPVPGDKTGTQCMPLSRGDFNSCCRKACGMINQQYGCSLACNNGECDHLSNPFSPPGPSSTNGTASFQSCLQELCPGNCTPRYFLGAESAILDCCKKRCGGDAACAYDCTTAAYGYKKNWGGGDTGGGGDGSDGDGSGGGDMGGGDGDSPAVRLRKKFIQTAVKDGGVPPELAPKVADCVLPILTQRFGVENMLDDGWNPSQDEKMFMESTLKKCFSQVMVPPPSPTGSEPPKSTFEKYSLWIYVGIGVLALLIVVLAIFLMTRKKRKVSRK